MILLLGPSLRFLNVYLVIGGAQNFQSSPRSVCLSFGTSYKTSPDNIQRQHPLPGFVPRHTTQSTIESYTSWVIKINEGPFLGRLPSVVALAAMDELGKLLGRYGPTQIIWAIKHVGRRFQLAFGNVIMESIQGVSLISRRQTRTANLRHLESFCKKRRLCKTFYVKELLGLDF